MAGEPVLEDCTQIVNLELWPTLSDIIGCHLSKKNCARYKNIQKRSIRYQSQSAVSGGAVLKDKQFFYRKN